MPLSIIYEDLENISQSTYNTMAKSIHISLFKFLAKLTQKNITITNLAIFFFFFFTFASASIVSTTSIFKLNIISSSLSQQNQNKNTKTSLPPSSHFYESQPKQEKHLRSQQHIKSTSAQPNPTPNFKPNTRLRCR